MDMIGKVMIPVCLILGACFTFWGAGYPAAREMAVAGAILLGAVLISIRRTN